MIANNQPSYQAYIIIEGWPTDKLLIEYTFFLLLSLLMMDYNDIVIIIPTLLMMDYNDIVIIIPSSSIL